MLDNLQISELLALEAEHTLRPANRAARRASRRAFLWTEEASDLVNQRRSLTELSAVGPYIERLIIRWLEEDKPAPVPPKIRSEFLTIAKARHILASKPTWLKSVKGDL